MKLYAVVRRQIGSSEIEFEEYEGKEVFLSHDQALKCLAKKMATAYVLEQKTGVTGEWRDFYNIKDQLVSIVEFEVPDAFLTVNE